MIPRKDPGRPSGFPPTGGGDAVPTAGRHPVTGGVLRCAAGVRPDDPAGDGTAIVQWPVPPSAAT